MMCSNFQRSIFKLAINIEISSQRFSFCYLLLLYKINERTEKFSVYEYIRVELLLASQSFAYFVCISMENKLFNWAINITLFTDKIYIENCFYFKKKIYESITISAIPHVNFKIILLDL